MELLRARLRNENSTIPSDLNADLCCQCLLFLLRQLCLLGRLLRLRRLPPLLSPRSDHQDTNLASKEDHSESSIEPTIVDMVDNGLGRLRSDTSKHSTEKRVASNGRGGLTGVGVDNVGEEGGVDPDDGEAEEEEDDEGSGDVCALLDGPRVADEEEGTRKEEETLWKGGRWSDCLNKKADSLSSTHCRLNAHLGTREKGQRSSAMKPRG